MLSASLAALMLKEQPFERFNFPRWQAVLGISLLGLIVGLDPGMAEALPDTPVAVVALTGFVFLWVTFLVTYWTLRWWMKRGGRWDGQGDLFNLIVAAWFVIDLIAFLLAMLGVPMILMLPVYLYSVWVAGNALSGAIPKATLGYSIGGILLSGIPAMLVMIVLMVLLGAVMAGMGWVPVPAGDGTGMPVG